MHGEVRIVDDVAAAFASLVVDLAPTSIALSGGETARKRLRSAGHPRPRLVGCRRLLRRRALGSRRRSRLQRRHGASCTARPRVAPRDPLDSGTPATRSRPPRTPTTRRWQPLRRSPWCTWASGPTATPRRCFRVPPRSTVRDRLVVPNGDDLHPHPRLTFTFPALAARAHSSSSPSRGPTRSTRSSHPRRRRSPCCPRHGGEGALARRSGRAPAEANRGGSRWSSGNWSRARASATASPATTPTATAGASTRWSRCSRPTGSWRRTGNGRYEGASRDPCVHVVGRRPTGRPSVQPTTA